MFSKDLVSHFTKHPTPFYYYDLERLRTVLKAVKQEADPAYHVHYAVKANANERVLGEILAHGLGVDCVSGGEIQRSLDVGFQPEQIAFAGVGKADWEIDLGLQHDLFSFNVESAQELAVINDRAGNQDKKARIALRINPDVNANTHKYITTGLEENKFGINPWELEEIVDQVRQAEHLKLTGIHFHIGSQITDLSSFRHLCLRANEFQQWFADRNIRIEHVNVGGGLGVDYAEPDLRLIPDFANFFQVFSRFLELRPGQTLHFELGRALVAHMGDLITRVLFVKPGIKTNFAIVDAGMTELIRPALYQAYHKIEGLTSTEEEQAKYDVVGPICESSDCFGKQVSLRTLTRGDLLAIRSTGAYAEVMASQYNLRSTAPVYFNDTIQNDDLP